MKMKKQMNMNKIMNLVMNKKKKKKISRIASKLINFNNICLERKRNMNINPTELKMKMIIEYLT